MAEVIAFLNKKGGVGKTTSAICTLDYLTEHGYKTLFLDLDESCNATLSLGVDKQKPTISDVLEGMDITKAIHKTERGSVIPSCDELAETEIPYIETLYEALLPVQKKFDYIIIDCPPSLSMLTTNALLCATKVVIPSQADISSLQGLGKLNTMVIPRVNAVRTQKGLPLIKIEGVLITMFNSRERYSNDFSKSLSDISLIMNTKVFETKIRMNVALKEAKALNQSIFKYAQTSNGALDYKAFCEELIK